MNGYCIDSDILIDYLRGERHARDFLVEVSKNTFLFISPISITEIYSGRETKDSDRAEQIERFLDNFQIIWLSKGVARRAGELRRDFGKPFADMIVAASALEYDSILVTRNIKHFKEIDSLRLLTPY